MSSYGHATDLHLCLRSKVNIAIGNRDILVDGHLRLKTGVRYGLVGRNGQGKSSMFSCPFTIAFFDLHITAIMKALADKIIPGVPENLRILLVGQVEDSPLGFNPSGDQTRLTVVEAVVQSDQRRESAVWEYKSTQRFILYPVIQIALTAGQSSSV